MTALVNHVKGNLETADFWKEGVPPNCAVTLVEVENKKPEIVFENRVYYERSGPRMDGGLNKRMGLGYAAYRNRRRRKNMSGSGREADGYKKYPVP